MEDLKSICEISKKCFVIITGVRPEDERAFASKSRFRYSCYSFNICEVQWDSSLRATWQIELAMHRAMLSK